MKCGKLDVLVTVVQSGSSMNKYYLQEVLKLRK